MDREWEMVERKSIFDAIDQNTFPADVCVRVNGCINGWERGMNGSKYGPWKVKPLIRAGGNVTKESWEECQRFKKLILCEWNVRKSGFFFEKKIFFFSHSNCVWRLTSESHSFLNFLSLIQSMDKYHGNGLQNGGNLPWRLLQTFRHQLPADGWEWIYIYGRKYQEKYQQERRAVCGERLECKSDDKKWPLIAISDNIYGWYLPPLWLQSWPSNPLLAINVNGHLMMASDRWYKLWTMKNVGSHQLILLFTCWPPRQIFYYLFSLMSLSMFTISANS